jgi:hypothetical protein
VASHLWTSDGRDWRDAEGADGPDGVSTVRATLTYQHSAKGCDQQIADALDKLANKARNAEE